MNDEEHEARVRAVVSGLFGRDAIYMMAWASQMVVTTLLTPVMTRLLVPAQFGRAMLAQTLVELLYGILLFGLYTGVQRTYARDGEAAARRVVALAGCLAIVGGAVVYLTGVWWAGPLGTGGFSTPIKYAVIWSVLMALTAPSLALIRSRDRLGWFIAVTFAQTIFAQVLAVAFVVSQGRSANEYLLGEIVGQVVAMTLALAVARPLRIHRADSEHLRSVFRFSVALMPAGVAGFVISLSDRLIVHDRLGSAEMARYSLAANIAGFAVPLLYTMGNVWGARLLVLTDHRARMGVVGASRDGLCELVAAYTVAVAAASPILLEIFSPHRYRPDALLLVVALVALTAVPTAATAASQQALIAESRTRTIAVVTIVGAMVNVALNLILIGPFGLDGSALASLLQAICSAIVYHTLLGHDRPSLKLTTWAVIVCATAVTIGSTGLSYHGPVLALRAVVMLLALGFCCVRLLSLASPARYDAFRNRLGSYRHPVAP
jgi:O-antigen/teichoic acid export membrane protein